ncbi:MAG TPA: hypothetical protein VF477_05365, partial [Mycobacterium sp.]
MAFSFAVAAAGAAHAQLTISSVTDSPDPVAAGGTVTYTVGISELNGSPVSGGSFTLDVPANGVYVGVGSLPPGVSCTGMVPNSAGPGVVSCSGITLAANQVALSELRVRSTLAGTLTVVANVPGGTQSQQTTVNQGADLAVTIGGPASAAAGSTQTYNLVVTNNGPDASPSSTATYTLPPGFGVATPPAGCTAAGQTLTCSVGNLASGATRTFPVSGVVGVGNGSTLTHAASVVAGGG